MTLVNHNEDEKPIRIAVQILNYNGKKWLEELLPTLKEHRDSNSVVYLLDNNSEDDSVEYFRSEMADGIVIHLAVNCGFSPAYNVAASTAWAAGCDWLCLLNNDIRVSANWMEPVRRLHKEDSRIGIIGSVFREWKGEGPNEFFKARHPKFVEELGKHVAHDIDWAEGSSMFIRKECWEDLGPFDPNYFIFWDEVEYCRRARNHDWRVVMACDSLVEHFGGGSVASGSAFRKPLMQLNCYAFKLTNPSSWFIANVARWMRLLLTEMRQVMQTENRLESAKLWGTNVLKTVFGLPSMYRRYRSHCRGDRMTQTDGRFAASFSDLTLRRN